MSERFDRLFSLAGNLYAESSPVIISAGALLKDTETGRVLAQLKFKNISPEPIKAIKVIITPMDTIGKPIGNEVFFDYLDLNEKRDSEFGQKKPIPMPNPATRSFMAEVTEVAFTNNTVWVASENAWNSLDALVSLEQALGDNEVVKQYRMRFGHKAAFQPHHSKDIWFCTCGAVNHDDEKGCHVCGNDENTLFSCDYNELKSDAARRVEQETAANIEQTKKRNKTLVLVASILVLCIATVFLITKIVIPNSKYNQAVALFDEGRYDEAITAFTELNGYKDSAEKIDAAKQAKIDAANMEQYTKAEQLLANGQYEEAISAFKALGSFRDSSEKMKEAETALLEAQYAMAEELLNNRQFDEAATAFESLGSYKDSSTRAKACLYAKAEELLKNKQFVEANKAFEALGSYKDSSTRAKACLYAKAEHMLSNGDQAHAAFEFYALGNYSDARARCVAIWDQIAQRDSIAGGGWVSVALKSNGTVIATGTNSNGEYNVSNWSDIIAVSAGWRHIVGLKANGTVVAVGDNDDGQCNVKGWTDIVAISAGEFFTVGLKADGTVVAVGQNRHGQRNVSSWTDIVAIAAGQDHTVGLRSDGTVVSTEDTYKYTSYDKPPDYQMRNVTGWSDIVAITASGDVTAGLKADGTVLTTWTLRNTVSEWTDIVAISAGSDYDTNHLVGLKSDGSVVAELLDTARSTDHGQTAVSGWKTIVAISAGGQHTLGLRADGTVVATKHNGLYGHDKGQCNVSGWKDILLPYNQGR